MCFMNGKVKTKTICFRLVDAVKLIIKRRQIDKVHANEKENNLICNSIKHTIIQFDSLLLSSHILFFVVFLSVLSS